MKLINLFAYITLVLAFLLVVVTGYWLLAPYTPIVFKGGPLQIENEGKTVKSGGHLSIFLDYCKYSKVAPEVNRTFSDGILYDVPLIVASEKETGCNQVNLQVYVPRALPTGTYTLKSVYRYQVNPLRKIDVTVETEPFTITK